MRKLICLLPVLLLHWFANAQGIVVTAGTHVTIASGTNFSANTDIQINPTGAVINSGTVSTTGDWNNTGVTGVGAGKVILNGSALQTISGTTQFDVLQLNNNAGASLQLGSDVKIMTALNLEDGDLDATNGSLTFLSTSVTHCAIIDDFSSGFSGTLSGAVHAQRFYNSSLTLNQHFMGSPVSTPALSQFGASGTPGYIIPTPTCDETVSASNSPYGTVFSYDETHNTGCGISNWKVETGGTAPDGVGFSILKMGSGTLTLTGPANLDATYPVGGLTNSNWSSVTLQGRTIASGWHLVTNPYLATLNISGASIAANSTAGFDNQTQVWNANGFFAGTYQTSTVISPFQAFMVHKTNPGGTATFTLNAGDRVITPTTFYRQSNESELKITSANLSTGLLDKTTIAFNSDATSSFDPQYDADKLSGALIRHTLYSLDNNRWMSMNVLRSISETGAVAVGFEPGVSGNYTFTFDGVQSFDATSYILLEDKKMNVMYNIRNGAYSFTSNASDNWNRFVLHFTPAAEIHTSAASCNAAGMVNIVQPGTAVWNYTLTDNLNATVASGTLSGNSPATVNASAGIYTLTLTDNTGYAVVKNIQVDGVSPVTAGFNSSAYSVEEGQELVLNSSSLNATVYNWNFDDGTFASSQTVTHSYAVQGVYNIVLTTSNSFGCSASANRTITVTPKSITGINNTPGKEKIAIWSNENYVNVDFTQMNKVNASIDIYNILGQQISNDKLTNNVVYRKQLSNIEAAYVIVRVKNGEELITRKVFIANGK